ncbi:hypothetical protein [Paraburkholderia monticola]
MIAAARWPARSDPANNQLALPMAYGRIWVLTQLLSMALDRKRLKCDLRDAVHVALCGDGHNLRMMLTKLWRLCVCILAAWLDRSVVAHAML